jgi:hypothetical protein
MKNPWCELNASAPPFILEIDSEYVKRHNNKYAGSERELMVKSIPEPFIGNPNTAKVVLLNLNPGHSQNDEADHRRPDIKNAIFANLRHEGQEYPFYALNPAFKETGVAEYWRQYTRELQAESGLDDQTFSKRLLVIEWFPYHSAKAGLRPGVLCDSQLYSFELAKQMLRKDGVQVVGTRSRHYWVEAGRELNRVLFLKNRQRPWITRRNMDRGVFESMLAALGAD